MSLLITLTVIGTGDGPTMMLAERGRRAVARVGSLAVQFDYVEVGALDKVNGVSQLPALAVAGRVLSEGGAPLPKMRDIEQALRDALEQAAPDDLKARAEPSAPLCGGCGRGCTLDAPKCRVGRERAAELSHHRG